MWVTLRDVALARPRGPPSFSGVPVTMPETVKPLGVTTVTCSVLNGTRGSR